MSKKKNILISMRQSFDFYITLILAIIIAILGIVGIVNQAIISSAILATLGLVSYSLIKNRKQDERIKHLIENLGNILEGTVVTCCRAVR